MPQSVYVLDSSIKDNILFGDKSFNREKLLQAVRYASLDKFVKNTNSGINYKVGEWLKTFWWSNSKIRDS